jgi:hypothetical protein
MDWRGPNQLRGGGYGLDKATYPKYRGFRGVEWSQRGYGLDISRPAPFIPNERLGICQMSAVND